jgi:hypothetical protein
MGNKIINNYMLNNIELKELLEKLGIDSSFLKPDNIETKITESIVLKKYEDDDLVETIVIKGEE